MSRVTTPAGKNKKENESPPKGSKEPLKNDKSPTFSNSTNICTTTSPLESNGDSKRENITKIQPFKIKNIINSVNSPKLSEKLNLYSQQEGVLSNIETQSFTNGNQAPFMKDEPQNFKKANTQSVYIGRGVDEIGNNQSVKANTALGLENGEKEVSNQSNFNKTESFFRQIKNQETCLLYTSPSPRDLSTSRMPSSA